MSEKELSVTSIEDAKQKVSDITVFGDGDTFALLCKASSKEQGWMKSTKVCNVDSGCIVQVSTQQKNPDGSYSLAEAVTFVPNVRIDTDAEPRKLVPWYEKLQAQATRLGECIPEPDIEYERRQYLEFLIQLQSVGHDCHVEINEQLAYLKNKLKLN